MKLFKKCSDGGEKSHVTAYVLIEWKAVFSIILLHFKPGTREAFHSHAFNALSFILWGWITEYRLHQIKPVGFGEMRDFKPSFIPKITTRRNCHKVFSHGHSWVLTFRGPWADTWQEYTPSDGELTTLTHGRKVVA